MAMLLSKSPSFRYLFYKSEIFHYPKVFSNRKFCHLTFKPCIIKNKTLNHNEFYHYTQFIRWKHTNPVARRKKKHLQEKSNINEKFEDISVIVNMLENENFRDISVDELPENTTIQTPEQDEFVSRDETQQLLETYVKTDLTVEHLEEIMSKIRINKASHEESRPKFSMGNPDPSIPVSDVNCPGCGSLLHCHNPDAPGYIPSEKFTSLDRDQLFDTLCFRCFLMKYHNYCLSVKVSIKECPHILSQIKTSRALVIVVVDMSDMNNSVLKTILPSIGKKRPIFVIGNKIDLIPMDSKNYLDRLKNSLFEACVEAGWNQHNNIKHVALVSAKTAYGIENLVTKILTIGSRYGDAYLVGCTNVGKSSVFNALLKSDLCKSQVRDLLQRATVSVWPGTTINLLKFPILRVTPERMFKRKKRLQEDEEKFQLLQKRRREKLDLLGLSKNAVLKGFVGQTQFLKEKPFEGHFDVSYSLSNDDSVMEFAKTKVKVQKHKEFSKITSNFVNSCWLYDTPGIENPEQIINILEPKEIQILSPKEMLRPRVVKLKSTQVMYITGLGCIEYVKGDMHVLFTVVSNLENPIHILESDQSESFFKQNIGTDVLKVPLGDKDRLSKLPSLVGTEFRLIGTGFKYIICDIVLSSIGWVGISANAGSKIFLRAFTPGGYGCHSRPALLPHSINLKKTKIKNSPFYLMRKPMSVIKSY